MQCKTFSSWGSYFVKFQLTGSHSGMGSVKYKYLTEKNKYRVPLEIFNCNKLEKNFRNKCFPCNLSMGMGVL